MEGAVPGGLGRQSGAEIDLWLPSKQSGRAVDGAAGAGDVAGPGRLAVDLDGHAEDLAGQVDSSAMRTEPPPATFRTVPPATSAVAAARLAATTSAT